MVTQKSESILVRQYRRWFNYERDVHAVVLRSLQSVPAEQQQSEGFQKALDLFAHILAARLMWLHRFGVREAPAELFPRKVGLADLPPLLQLMQDEWDSYLALVNEAELARVFEYRSYEGSRFRNSIEDILTQLSGHSWYHRGQIAMLLRSIGAEPPVTDFVFWSREPIE